MRRKEFVDLFRENYALGNDMSYLLSRTGNFVKFLRNRMHVPRRVIVNSTLHELFKLHALTALCNV